MILLDQEYLLKFYLKETLLNDAIKVPENAVYEEKYVYLLNENNAVRAEIRVEGYIDNH